MKISFEDYLNKKINQDGALISSFQPGHNGGLSLYAQSRVYEHCLQHAENNSQLNIVSQDLGFSA